MGASDRSFHARRLTAIDGAMALLVVLLIVQMWLLTAALESFLAGHAETALPAAILSGLLFAACGAIYLFVHRLDAAFRKDALDRPGGAMRNAPLVLIAVALTAAALASPAFTATASASAGVQPWKPKGISSAKFESHAAFDPVTGDFYFVRSSPQFEGWRILVSQCGPEGWSEPRPPVFAGEGVEADPYFTPDGKSLYYISTRPVEGVKRSLDIWRVDRDPKGGWGAPERLPEPVNSSAPEWFPRPARDGWLYFGSGRPGGLGRTDIWRARAGSEGRWSVENLGPAVNTAGDEYEPLPSPDGSRIIVMADGALYETRKVEGGWSPRVKLSAEVNATGTEIGAVFSPSGKSLLFSRDTKGADSGEFFLLRQDGDESWPPECPPRKP